MYMKEVSEGTQGERKQSDPVGHRQILWSLGTPCPQALEYLSPTDYVETSIGQPPLARSLARPHTSHS